MSDLVLLDVDDWLIECLERRAEAHGRPPAQEAKAILQEALAQPPAVTWQRANAIRQQLATTGKEFSDSAQLIREDRDR